MYISEEYSHERLTFLSYSCFFSPHWWNSTATVTIHKEPINLKDLVLVSQIVNKAPMLYSDYALHVWLSSFTPPHLTLTLTSSPTHSHNPFSGEEFLSLLRSVLYLFSKGQFCWCFLHEFSKASLSWYPSTFRGWNSSSTHFKKKPNKQGTHKNLLKFMVKSINKRK